MTTTMKLFFILMVIGIFILLGSLAIGFSYAIFVQFSKGHWFVAIPLLGIFLFVGSFIALTWKAL